MNLFARRPSTRSVAWDPFTDLLFNTLLGFTLLFLVAIMYMNPIAKQGVINPKAEYIITITWPDNDAADIDAWVEEPSGGLIWFRAREVGLVHLDRDDRGLLNDTFNGNGRTVKNPLNQEIVTIRGVIPGEYIVNVHYYATESGEPVPVGVRVDKVNPSLEVIYYDTLTLAKKGDEHTAVRFNIGADGSVSNINRLQKKGLVIGAA